MAGIDLANFAVGTLQLANLGVTRAKIADGAVGNTQIAPFSLLNNRIGSAQVDNRTLATGAVNSRAILNGAVAAADLATINTRTSTETIEASTVNLVTANCAVGEILLGGGENWLELGDTEIIESHRTSGQGWAVRVVNLFQEGDLDFRAEAYCLAL